MKEFRNVEMEDTVVQGFALQEMVEMTNHLALTNLGYLTVCVAILSLVAGALYFFGAKPQNEKLAEQEKRLADMEKEVGQNLSSAKAELKADLEKFKTANRSELISTVDQKHDTLISEVATKVAIFENSFTEKFDKLATEKDENMKGVILAESGKEMSALKDQLLSEIAKLKGLVAAAELSSQKASAAAKEIKIEMLDLQIDWYNRRNKIGELRKMIEKLVVANERGWGADSALISIKEYVTEYKMPDVYLKELNEALKGVKQDELQKIKEEIEKLASEKIYKVGS